MHNACFYGEIRKTFIWTPPLPKDTIRQVFTNHQVWLITAAFISAGIVKPTTYILGHWRHAYNIYLRTVKTDLLAHLGRLISLFIIHMNNLQIMRNPEETVTTITLHTHTLISFFTVNTGNINVNVLKFWTFYSILFWSKFCFLGNCILTYLVEWQTV